MRLTIFWRMILTPQTPWAYQGQAWVALINKTLALEAIRRRLQADLRTRAATTRSLQGHLDHSRDIAVEIDKKKREFLR